MSRERSLRQSLGTTYGKLKQSRVLLIGAGGIGCELLKNLVLTGFGEIHIVDLDTIDLSNLNRQFLFRQEHIKKSKALVAKESAAKFNPHVKLEAHHANIKDPNFDVEWFRKFEIVFNALDNLEARRHVNRMCLAAERPLIESGTTGFNGQVQVIIKGKSECYDCNTKEVPKTFPVCTIRSTPSQPIHCIVWAKSYLFTEVYGVSEEDSPEFDHSEDSENTKEIENLRKEAEALKKIRDSIGSPEFARSLFQKVFKDDVLRLRSMEDMWKSRDPPTELDFEILSKTKSQGDSGLAKDDQRIWNEAENFAVFCDSLQRLNARLQHAQAAASETSATVPILSFDKDDEDILDFVASAANLRSIVFGMECKSKFDIKQMAGNIIPAIATTNAMIAGLCVLQAIKVIKGNLEKARMIFLERSAARVISSEKLQPPKPDCPVCSVAQVRLLVDPTRATLGNLVEDLIKVQLGYGTEFSVSNEVGTLYDPDLEDNVSKSFEDLGVKNGSFLTVVDDEDESPRVNLSLLVSETSLPADSSPVQVSEKPDIPKKPKAPQQQPQPSETNGTTSNGVSNKTVEETSGSKRKRSIEAADDQAESPQALKKGKVQNNAKEDDSSTTIIVEDSNNSNGSIVIDDD